MAKIHGHGGVLKVGGVDVGHLQGWNLDVQANVTEGYSMGNGWADNEATVKVFRALSADEEQSYGDLFQSVLLGA